jgi:hypothetical protein
MELRKVPFPARVPQDRQRTFTEEDFQKVYEFARNMSRLFGGGVQATSSAADVSFPPSHHVSGQTVAPPARSSMMMAFDLSRGRGRGRFGNNYILSFLRTSRTNLNVFQASNAPMSEFRTTIPWRFTTPEKYTTLRKVQDA